MKKIAAKGYETNFAYNWKKVEMDSTYGSGARKKQCFICDFELKR